MTRVLYPGSFDPIHNGHLELIEVAAEVFDEVVVATIRNPQKSKGLFDIDERLAMIEESVAHLPNVSVTSFASLVVDLARELQADFILKGLRAVSDFESELQQAQMNEAISGIHTMFLPSATTHSFVASKLICGWPAASSQSLPSMWSFIIGFGTCSEAASTTILPVKVAGLAGSKVTVPLMRLAVPLMASSGASSLKVALLTPFGSLKSKLWGAASALAARQAAASSRRGRWAEGFIGSGPSWRFIFNIRPGRWRRIAFAQMPAGSRPGTSSRRRQGPGRRPPGQFCDTSSGEFARRK